MSMRHLQHQPLGFFTGHVQHLTMQPPSLLWTFPLYNQKSDETGLVGGAAKEFSPSPDMASPYKLLVLEYHVCSFSVFDQSLVVNIKTSIDPLTLCCFLENLSQGHLWTRLLPSMVQVGVGMFCRRPFHFKLSGKCILVSFSN